MQTNMRDAIQLRSGGKTGFQMATVWTESMWQQKSRNREDLSA